MFIKHAERDRERQRETETYMQAEGNRYTHKHTEEYRKKATHTIYLCHNSVTRDPYLPLHQAVCNTEMGQTVSDITKKVVRQVCAAPLIILQSLEQLYAARHDIIFVIP